MTSFFFRHAPYIYLNNVTILDEDSKILRFEDNSLSGNHYIFDRNYFIHRTNSSYSLRITLPIPRAINRRFRTGSSSEEEKYRDSRSWCAWRYVLLNMETYHHTLARFNQNANAASWYV